VLVMAEVSVSESEWVPVPVAVRDYIQAPESV